MTKKPIYNYNIEQCNRLFKKGIHPIGVSTHDKTGNVFHVFRTEKRYFDMLAAVMFEMEQEQNNNQSVISCK